MICAVGSWALGFGLDPGDLVTWSGQRADGLWVLDVSLAAEREIALWFGPAELLSGWEPTNKPWIYE
eukprot:gene11577-34277_t